MSDFLRHLAGRTLGLGDVVRPRLAIAFEPDRGEAATQLEPVAAIEAPVPVDSRPRAWAPPLPAAKPARPPAVSRPGKLPIEPPASRRSAPGRGPLPAARHPPPIGKQDAAGEPLPKPQHSSAARQPGETRLRPGPDDSRSGSEALPSKPAAASPREPVADTGGEVRPRAAVPVPVPARPPERNRHAGEGQAAAGQPPAGPPRISSSGREAGAEVAEEPSVHVHIGQIEVRSPSPPKPVKPPPPRRSLLSLDEYLEQAAEGRR